MITLLDYQEEARKKLQNTPKCALFMKAGSGKTYTALALVRPNTKNLLVITVSKDEKSGKWQKHARDFGYVGNIDVVNYEKLRVKARYDVYFATKYDCIIVDECHKVMQSPAGKKANDSSRVNKLTKKAPQVIGLTATFSPNNYKDTFNILRSLDCNPFGYGSQDIFIESYFHYKEIPTAYGTVKTPTKLKEDTKEHLFMKIDSVAFRYFPEDVEHELTYHYIDEPLHEVYHQAVSGIFLNDTIDHLKKVSLLQQLANGFYYDKENTYVLDTHKQAYLKQLMYKHLDDDIIVVYKYKEDLEQIKEALADYPNEYMVLQVSQSEAQNLQEYNRIVFYTISFSHKDLTQMKARIMRLYQKRVPKFDILLRKHTIEEHIRETVENKGTASSLYEKFEAASKKRSLEALKQPLQSSKSVTSTKRPREALKRLNR